MPNVKANQLKGCQHSGLILQCIVPWWSDYVPNVALCVWGMAPSWAHSLSGYGVMIGSGGCVRCKEGSVERLLYFPRYCMAGTTSLETIVPLRKVTDAHTRPPYPHTNRSRPAPCHLVHFYSSSGIDEMWHTKMRGGNAR